MKQHTIQTAIALAIFASSAAHAQDAVQWMVSDGGNGHWYSVDATLRTWIQAESGATNRGAHLASFTSVAEQTSAFQLTNFSQQQSIWIGLIQAAGAQEPAGGWAWVTGEPISFSGWTFNNPNDDGGENVGEWTPSWGGGWNDMPAGELRPALLEWSTDCNNDNIVDYGQCHDGTLPDYNGNNIPDCCERGDACVLSHYPVQWRAEDGGNGHWYQPIRADPTPASFAAQDAFAMSRGAVMATMTTAMENAFVISLMSAPPTEAIDAFFGLRRRADGAWAWCDQTPLGYTAWGGSNCAAGPYPNNDSMAGEMCGHLYLRECGWVWDDTPVSWAPIYAIRMLLEWSADCNHDGIVDYGQILQGQLADANSDGVPDVCQQFTCHDADLFVNGVINGADLGILLSQWGPAPIGTVSDINRDGQVDGVDLGFLLNAWGPCPN
jgi:hypothetical protein